MIDHNDVGVHLLKPDERVDDLSRCGLKIIQHAKSFRFAVDAVLLSEFAKINTKMQVLDMGCGTGVISLLVYARYKPKKIIGLELAKDMVEMAQRSIELNSLDEFIQIVEGDIKCASEMFGHDRFDAVITNPPYIKQTAGTPSLHENVAMARHEICCTLKDVIANASLLLKSKGKFYMVHRPGRLCEIMSLMNMFNLSPSRLRLVQSKFNKSAVLVLIEAIKGVKCELEAFPNLVIYNEDGNFSDEMKKIYFD